MKIRRAGLKRNPVPLFSIPENGPALGAVSGKKAQSFDSGRSEGLALTCSQDIFYKLMEQG
jgi:hypothetical protein